MGYPHSVLAADEHVVLHRHPHWRRLVGPVLALLSCTAAGSFAAAVVSRTGWEPHTRQLAWAVIGAGWMALVAWLTLRPLVAWKSTHFVITDRRLMCRRGVLTRAGIDIPLARVTSVEFRHGLLDRMVRTGTLVIESAAQDPLEFGDIPQLEYVHSLIYHEIFDLAATERG